MGLLEKKIEKQQSDLGEKATKIIFDKFYGLRLLKIPREKDKKTPDYKILDATGNLVAICEVKSFLDIATTETSFDEISPEEDCAISRKKELNRRSKVEKRNNEAMRQLAGYPDLPKIIVFGSFDMTDAFDVQQKFQERKELNIDYPLADVYALVKIHQDITGADTFQIKETILFMHSTDRGRLFLEKYCPRYDEINRVGLLPLAFRVD